MTDAEITAEPLLPSYRVLDLADEKGVFCTKLLADLGADVVKVEPPSGDRMRSRGPFVRDEASPEKSLYFLFYNTNKRSITLNLEHRDGQVLFRELVKSAEAVVETFPVGYLSGLGLDYPSLSKINPRLVMASITPFGQTGSWKEYKSSDLVSMATSGYMQVIGEPGGSPVRLGNEQSHFAPSQYAALAVVAALYSRDVVSGRGQHIDISMQEAIITYYLEQHPALCWRVRGENVTRVGRVSDLVVPCGAFPCQDGWVGMCILTPQEWESFVQWIHEVTGREEILDERFKEGGMHARANHKDVIEAIVTDFTMRLTKTDLFHEGQRRNLVVVPVNTVEELLADPQLEAMRFWEELDHPVAGRLQYPLGILTGEMAVGKRAAPLLGQHNDEIYCGELGCSPQEVVFLRGAGII